MKTKGCEICQCTIWLDEDGWYESQFGITCVLCYRALEIKGAFW